MRAKWVVGAAVFCPEFKIGGKIVSVTTAEIRVRWYNSDWFIDGTTGTMSRNMARKMLTLVSDPENA